MNIAGRVTLVESVLSSIPVYTMHTCLLPKGNCDELDKIVRSFVWNGNDGFNKIHLVDWQTMCRPKRYGGVGLRNFHDESSSHCKACLEISS